MNITSSNFTSDKIDTAWSKYGLKVDSGHLFSTPGISVGSNNIKESDYRSTFSEYTSPRAELRVMSTIDSVAEDDGLPQKASPTKPYPTAAFSSPYSYQMPQVQLTWNNQQHQIQNGYNFLARPVAVPSFGNTPCQILPMPIILPISQHVFFPSQQV